MRSGSTRPERCAPRRAPPSPGPAPCTGRAGGRRPGSRRGSGAARARRGRSRAGAVPTAPAGGADGPHERVVAGRRPRQRVDVPVGLPGHHRGADPGGGQAGVQARRPEPAPPVVGRVHVAVDGVQVDPQAVVGIGVVVPVPPVGHDGVEGEMAVEAVEGRDRQPLLHGLQRHLRDGTVPAVDPEVQAGVLPQRAPVGPERVVAPLLGRRPPTSRVRRDRSRGRFRSPPPRYISWTHEEAHAGVGPSGPRQYSPRSCAGHVRPRWYCCRTRAPRGAPDPAPPPGAGREFGSGCGTWPRGTGACQESRSSGPRRTRTRRGTGGSSIGV